MDNIINIVYIVANLSHYSTMISLESLFENNSNNKINITFIADSTVRKDLIKIYEDFAKQQPNIGQYKTVFVDRTKYRYFINNPKFIFVERLYLAEVPELVDYDKFIYLSSSTIINSDLNELFNINISNNSCGGVEYVNPQNIKTTYNFNSNKIIFSNHVLLVNCKKWKENNYAAKILNTYELNNFKKPIGVWVYLNTIINDCKLINYKYEYTEECNVTNPSKFGCSANTLNLYKKFWMHKEKPVIIYINSQVDKQFANQQHSYADLWWEYAKKTPFYEEIKEYKNANKYKLSATSAQNSFRYGWLLSRIWPYIKPYWFRILIGFAIAIPLGLLDGVTAFALKPYMDYVIGGKEFVINAHGLSLNISSIQMSYILPIGVILFAVFQGVLRYLNGYISTWTSQRITNDVKFDLFNRLIHMHPQFFDENSSGIVISRYMSDPGTASAGIVNNLKTITTSLFGALGLIAVMIYSSWQLAIIGVLVLCVAFIPVALIRKRIKDASNKNMVIGGNITTNINETYSGNKVMAAYELQNRQDKYFREQIKNSFNINMSLYKRAGWMSPLMYLIASFGIATVLGVGTYLINSNQMTAGSFASFVTSLLLLYKPVKTLGNTLTGIQNIFVAMGRVFELFDLNPEIKDSPNAKVLKGLNDSITFENVNFEYIPEHPVLHNLNLKVNKGETLAIVGNSGGGKSTLVNLLPRFYDIKSGSVNIDGEDIRNFTIKSLRQNISMVFQDNFLYTGTIKENIMMGNPKATYTDLSNAIKSAHLEEMICELPEGIDTLLGERGLTLSGGQRQRVAIARAMLRNAPIVILDEATSALDNESEAIVQKAMDNLMQNKTVFIIAHRLSTIKNADRIAVINEGRLVELGTHDELMAIENGEYKTLYEMQFKRQEEKQTVYQ